MELCSIVHLDFHTGCQCKPYLDVEALLNQLEDLTLYQSGEPFAYIYQ
jgi:hypothetical protein